MSDNNAAILAALETAWEVIQGRHPDLPDVTVTTGAAVTKDGLRWSLRDSVAAQEVTAVVSTEPPELRLSGETLQAGPKAVLTAILHQATHAQCALRGIRDCTNRYKWHNRKFREAALEFGLAWPEGMARDLKRGFSDVRLTKETQDTYAPLLDALDGALKTWKRTAKKAAAAAPKAAGRTDSRLGLTCGCGRKMYMAKTSYAQGGVTCDVCGEKFEVR
ncbi:hypothetical protein ACFWJW_00715 [Streptomyces sp. NPDC127097]|uniref:hypothetical protein n=1 Tax=Streptomyces sp. NPDC127097 TaxID=3347136 RepID=UPI00365C9517